MSEGKGGTGGGGLGDGVCCGGGGCCFETTGGSLANISRRIARKSSKEDFYNTKT